MEKLFKECTILVKQFSVEQSDQLKLYSYYKQATLGDNKTPSPSFFDMRGCAKWNAWNLVKGLSKNESMTKYIQLVAFIKKNLV